MKSILYSDITDENINKAISFKDAQKIEKSINKRFDTTLSNYKTGLKEFAIEIANSQSKLLQDIIIQTSAKELRGEFLTYSP